MAICRRRRQGTGDPVFVVKNSEKRHIAGREVFEACSYEWGNVNRIADSSLAEIALGPDLTLADCQGT